MKASHPARISAAALVLAALLMAPGPAAARRVQPAADPFPGLVQPDDPTAAGVSRNGRAVAFAASMRENGDRYDAAATPTVFFWERRTGTLRQITSAGPSDQPSVENANFHVELGSQGTDAIRGRSVVAFRSTADLAGSNADGSAEIFVWDSATGQIVQVTDALAGASSAPAIAAQFSREEDANGRDTGNIRLRWRVAFLSTSDLTGDNPSGLLQVFTYDSGAPEVARLVQVTHATVGAADAPVVNRRGDRIAFVHDGDVLPGEPAPPAPAVYVWDRHFGLQRAEVDGDDAAASDPALDVRGRFVAWTALPVSGRREIRVADLRRGRVRTVKSPVGEHRQPSLGRGRGRIVALSTVPVPREDGSGSPPVSERPVLIHAGRRPTVRSAGLDATGTFGPPRLLRDRPRAFVVSDADLGGLNASGRDVLWLVHFGRR